MQTETAVRIEQFSRIALYLYQDRIYRHKEIQRQLEKITDMVRLIVQKMNIVTETEVDGTFDRSKTESHVRVKKFQQLFQAARRFTRSETLHEG